MTNYLMYLGYGLISLGVLFNFVSALTLLRYPDIYSRLLSSTKCISLGTASILIGVFVIHGFNAIGIKSLLCLVFVLLTFPVETHTLLRAARRQGIEPHKPADRPENTKKKS